MRLTTIALMTIVLIDALQPITLFADDEPSSLVAEGAEVKLLADGFEFTEGPAADAEGNVYFTDQPNDAIHIWTVTGELKKFAQPCGRANGLFFDAQGTLWSCADERNQLWATTKDGQSKAWVTAFDEKLLNGPNDLWINKDGAIYFTDPYYKRPYWPADRGRKQQPSEAVYRLSPDHSRVTRVAEGFVRPNGIVGDASRKVLYVADIAANKTYRFQIAADGSLTEREEFCASGSDGMTLDAEGNLYLTGSDGVTVFGPDGQQRELIRVPERWTANVTFGGPDHDTLFITASDSLYAVKMRVKGVR